MTFVSQHTKTLTAITLSAACYPIAVQSADKVPVQSFPLGSSDVLNFGGGLVVVVLAIILLGALYAWTQGSRNSANGLISVIATQAIGPKEKIAIVSVADKQLLIGSTTTSVHTLHVFDEPIALVAEAKISFATRLKSALRSESR